MLVSDREDARAQLLGRYSELAAISRARPALLVLHGDSGVGKSALLAAAQAQTDNAIAPDPIEVYSSDGAVQQAVLDALSSALALLLFQEPWVGARATILDFIRRLLTRGVSETGRIAGLGGIGESHRRR